MAHEVKRGAPGRPLRPTERMDRRATRRHALDLWVFDYHLDLVGAVVLIALALVLFLQFGRR